MRYIIIIVFVCMCIAQISIPGKMIFDSEYIIDNGRAYKFKTAPIDPSDPFRGKYITLSFESNAMGDTTKWSTGEAVNVKFDEDSNGFAIPVSITHEVPEGPYLHTTIQYTSAGNPPLTYFNLPFDRFYLEESKASEAEQQYWQASRDSTQVAYAIVKMGSGNAVLTDVIINDKSVTELVKELNSNP